MRGLMRSMLFERRPLALLLALCAVPVACDENKPQPAPVTSAAPSAEKLAIASALAAASAAPSASAAEAEPRESAEPEASASPAAEGSAASPSGPPAGKAAAKADARGVKLVEAGAEPRQKVRYKFVVDRTDRVEMTTTSKMKMSMGTESADVPTAPAVRVVAALTVKEVAADGSAARTLLLEDVGLMPGPGLSKAQRDQAGKALGALSKMTGTDRVDARGFVRQVRLDGSKIDNPALKQALASMQQTFDQMGAPFPEEEIGVGAKWQVKTRIDQMGIRLSQTADYELSALEGDKGRIKLKLKQSAPGGNMALPGLPKGATAKLTSMKGSGQGELAFDLGRSTPDGHIDTKSEVRVSVVSGDETQQMNTKMTARVVFKPLTK